MLFASVINDITTRNVSREPCKKKKKKKMCILFVGSTETEPKVYHPICRSTCIHECKSIFVNNNNYDNIIHIFVSYKKNCKNYIIVIL